MDVVAHIQRYITINLIGNRHSQPIHRTRLQGKQVDPHQIFVSPCAPPVPTPSLISSSEADYLLQTQHPLPLLVDPTDLPFLTLLCQLIAIPQPPAPAGTHSHSQESNWANCRSSSHPPFLQFQPPSPSPSSIDLLLWPLILCLHCRELTKQILLEHPALLPSVNSLSLPPPPHSVSAPNTQKHILPGTFIGHTHQYPRRTSDWERDSCHTLLRTR